MTVHLIASCTDRKRGEVPDELRLRELPVGNKRASKWVTRLAHSSSPTKPARDLYGGEHWQLVLELEAALLEMGRAADLWVASAGYGLVSADTNLKPYSATFAPREPDSVPPEDATHWWTELCAASHAKSLQTLVAPADTLVVIASAKYLRAMLPDLQAARQTLTDPQQLIVFSGSQVPELSDSLVRVDSRVQVALQGETDRELRGTKQGLAARAALRLLSRTKTWPPTTTAIQNAYARLVSDVRPPKAHDRERHDDDDVRAFIVAQLEQDARAGWTKLLREWRGRGQACEQKRFRNLYQAVRAEQEK